jgi:hypothetical protein
MVGFYAFPPKFPEQNEGHVGHADFLTYCNKNFLHQLKIN